VIKLGVLPLVFKENSDLIEDLNGGKILGLCTCGVIGIVSLKICSSGSPYRRGHPQKKTN